MTPLEAFASLVSARAQYDELQMQRALGVDWIEAYAAAWRVMDEVHALVFETDRPAVYLPCRTISRANAGTPI